jgi:hypothetical protein
MSVFIFNFGWSVLAQNSSNVVYLQVARLPSWKVENSSLFCFCAIHSLWHSCQRQTWDHCDQPPLNFHIFLGAVWWMPRIAYLACLSAKLGLYVARTASDILVMKKISNEAVILPMSILPFIPPTVLAYVFAFLNLLSTAVREKNTEEWQIAQIASPEAYGKDTSTIHIIINHRWICMKTCSADNITVPVAANCL